MAVDEQADTKVSAKPVLVVILILELLSLLPWAVFAALAGMGFDAGFNWKVVLFVGPLWAYPVLILICGVTAFSLNEDENVGGAILAVLIPPLVSLGVPLVVAGFL